MTTSTNRIRRLPCACAALFLALCIPFGFLQAQAGFEIDVHYNSERASLIFEISHAGDAPVGLMLEGQAVELTAAAHHYFHEAPLASLGRAPGERVAYALVLNGMPLETREALVPQPPPPGSEALPAALVMNNGILASGADLAGMDRAVYFQPQLSLLETIWQAIRDFFTGLWELLFGGGEPAAVNFHRYTVRIPFEPDLYDHNVSDYHIVFKGKVKACYINTPPGPMGWVCRIGPENTVTFYNEGGQGQDLTAGNVLDGMMVETDPPNAGLKDYWITRIDLTASQPVKPDGTLTSERIKREETFQVTFEDCNNYCPPKTNTQFRNEVTAHLQQACNDILHAASAVGAELDRIQTLGAGEQGTLDKVVANKTKLQDILLKTLKKCRAGIRVECDTASNWNCDSDTLAYVPAPFGSTSNSYNLHLCPKFCTGRGQQATLLHELTHYGGSTDDLDNDPVNAHALESIVRFLSKAWCRESLAYMLR